jgi:hypothetical protein
VVESTKVVTPPAEGEESNGQEPDPVRDESASVSTVAAPREPKETFMDIPRGDEGNLPEATGSTFPRGARGEGRDRPVQEQDQVGETTPPRADREEGRDQPHPEQGEIDALLAKAELAMSKNRLTVPSEDNAYTYYQRVLALDPENAQASAGIGRIVNRYRQLARQRLRRGDWRGARRFASRGLKIWPRDAKLQYIKRRATRSRAVSRERSVPEALEVPEPLKRIREWFRSGDTKGSAFLEQ